MADDRFPQPFDEDLPDVLESTSNVPVIVRNAGRRASERFIEFFAARIRNPGTRTAYARAAARFLQWCDDRRLSLNAITPFVVAAYIEKLGGELKPPTVKLHLSAITMLFDDLVVGQVVPINPAASVRGPKHVVRKGKTPVLSAEQTRLLIDSIDCSTVIGLRDRALVAVMVYSFARVSAVVGMNVEDFFQQGRRMWFRLHEKGGKHHEVPAHHNADEYVADFLCAANILDEKRGPLFRTIGKDRRLTLNRMHRNDVLRMLKRRAKVAGLPPETCCHSFRATGITVYLENGGSLEHAQRIAAHESVRTTKLYDRSNDAVSLDEIQRIRI